MTLINHYFNTKPVIAHNPFSDLPNNLWEMLCTKNIEFKPPPKEVTIVTWNNRPFESNLQKQLKKQNVSYLCLGANENWTTNRLKPKTLLDVISNIKTKYILGLDCFDVMIVGSLHSILNKFKHKKTKLLYNATGTVYPYCQAHLLKEKTMCLPPFQFFNSGVFLGYTNFIEIILKSLDLTVPEYPMSDQYLIRQLYHQHFPKIQIDWNCELFQVMYLEKEDIGRYVSLQPKLL